MSNYIVTIYNCVSTVINLDQPNYSPESTSYNSLLLGYNGSNPALITATPNVGPFVNNNIYAGVYAVPNFATWAYIVYNVDQASYPWPNGYGLSVANPIQVDTSTNTATINITISQMGTGPSLPNFCVSGPVEIDNIGLNFNQNINLIFNVSCNFSPAPATSKGNIVLHPIGSHLDEPPQDH